MSHKKTNKTNDKKISGKRLLLFKVIGLLLPFIILSLLELGLRVFHYGYDTSLFIEYKVDNNYLVLNPEASKKYFSNQAIATIGNTEPFKKEKDDNTLRVFVLGESTTIGYPYFHNGSFHRWLQYRLMRTFPDKNFEIINLSLTAVNSYTVRGFAKEIVKYQPDAVLIYSGHNEYYGALGVGSTDKAGGNPFVVNTMLKLRDLKVVQLFTNVYYKVSNSFKSKDSSVRRTRMEFMVADQQIPLGSPLYNKGITQFETNMDATLAILNQHHIPVFISNLVSNQKDMKPFISINTGNVNLSSFKKNYDQGVSFFEKGDYVSALNFFTKALAESPEHAACNYYLGRLAYIKGDFVNARQYFIKAKELDALRFRAPEKINSIIAQLCNKYSNAHLVDSKKVFENSSQDHITGNELVLEHVHPNLRGYGLLSDVFYEEMKKEKIFPAGQANEISFEQLQQSMPVTQMDSLTGEYRIEHLKRSWPFKETQLNNELNKDSLPVNTEEEKAGWAVAAGKMSWVEANEKLYKYYIKNHDLPKAKTLMETLVLEHSTEEAYYTDVANICGELKEDDDATYYFRRSFALVQTPEKAKYLFVLYFKQDKPAEAIPYLDYVIRNGGGRLTSIKSLAGDIIQLQNIYVKDSTNLPVLNEIAGKYVKMGNKDVAEKYIDKVLRADGANKDALLLLSQLRSQQKQNDIH